MIKENLHRSNQEGYRREEKGDNGDSDGIGL